MTVSLWISFTRPKSAQCRTIGWSWRRNRKQRERNENIEVRTMWNSIFQAIELVSSNIRIKVVYAWSQKQNKKNTVVQGCPLSLSFSIWREKNNNNANEKNPHKIHIHCSGSERGRLKFCNHIFHSCVCYMAEALVR